MKIQMIPIERVFSHPNNPRTSVGDISELVASIATMGILQNLTVVPYDPAVHKNVDGLTGDGSGCYIAVAGNRRLAAARKAKLTEVPAVISDMDFLTQNKVMLVENLQRESVTPYQQAKIMQLMLNLGDSVENIAKETGFSENTVRSRLKLTCFAPDKMAEVEGRNASIKDYLDLAKLEDEDLRNEALQHIGTKDFANELARARSRQRDRRNREAQRAALMAFATEIPKDQEAGKVFVRTYYGSDNADKIEAPADKDTVAYFFIDNTYSITVYREKTSEDDLKANARAQREAEVKEKALIIKEATARAAELRKSFMENLAVSKVKQNFSAVVAAMGVEMFRLATARYTYIGIEHSLLASLLAVAPDKDGKVSQTDVQLASQQCPEWAMFALACATLEYGNADGYSLDEWVNVAYARKHQKNEKLDVLYDLLIAMGYPMSTEEKHLQDGTHPDFYVPASQAKKTA